MRGFTFRCPVCFGKLNLLDRVLMLFGHRVTHRHREYMAEQQRIIDTLMNE